MKPIFNSKNLFYFCTQEELCSTKNCFENKLKTFIKYASISESNIMLQYRHNKIILKFSAQ